MYQCHNASPLSRWRPRVSGPTPEVTHSIDVSRLEPRFEATDVTGVTYGLKVTDKGGNPVEIPVSVSLVNFEWGLGLGATRTNHS